MDVSVFKGVKDLYFGGDLNAASENWAIYGFNRYVKSVEEIINNYKRI